MNTRVTLLLLALWQGLSPAWSRSVSVSLNMSMTRTVLDERNGTKQSAQLNQPLLESCMRETDISMSQLKLFRLSLLLNENSNNNAGNELAAETGDADADMNTANNLADTDYGNGSPYLDMKKNEPLQCFVRCLYESLGLVHYDMMLEEAFKLQLQNLMQRQKSEVKECRSLESRNRCEAAYKLHLCYNHLKNLETEQRLHEMLERSEANSEFAAPEDEPSADEQANGRSELDKANEILDAMKHIS